MVDVKENLMKLNIKLEEPTKPLASYVSFVKVGKLLYLSGQLSSNTEKSFTGKAGINSNIDDLQKAAEVCCINMLNQLNSALDEQLEKVKKCVKITVFVNCEPDFHNEHIVANGCSDLLIKVFGNEIGSHTRSAIGVCDLPKNSTVEVEGIFEIFE